MGTPSTTGSRYHPLFLGMFIGLLLSVLLGIFAPAADLKPEDSRVLMAIGGAIFLVPGSILTAYAARSAFRSVRQTPKLSFVWLTGVIFFTIAVTLSASSEKTRSRRFIAEGQTTDGRVIETHPEDHDTLLVAYTVSGIDYRSQSQGPMVARDYHPGSPIQVYYYASTPAQGFFVEPRWRPGLAFVSWLLAAGVLPIWATAAAGAADEHHRRRGERIPPVSPLTSGS